MTEVPPGCRVLVAGWVGSTNLGDELLYRALSRQLIARGAAPVAVSTDPPATTQLHGTRAVGDRDPAAWWRELEGPGRLVFGGGGLLQDESSRLNVPYHLSRVALARARRARVVAVGLGGGVLHGPSRGLVRSVLRGVPIAARDRATVRQLAALGLRAELSADLAFSLPPPQVEVRDELVVSLRPRNVGGGWRPVADAWQQGLPTATQAARLAARLEAVAGSLGLAIRFVALQAERDGVVHERIAEHLSRVPVELVTPTVDTVLEELGRGQLVVAMRFHGALGGLVAGRPVLAAAYSQKVAELSEDAPHAVQLVPRALTELGIDQARAALATPVAAREGERDALIRRERRNGDVLDGLLA